MSKLPNPFECKQHIPDFSTEEWTNKSSSSNYDLADMHHKFLSQKALMLKGDKEGLLIEGFNLIEDRLYQSFYGRESESTEIIYQEHYLLNDPVLIDMFGYSFKDKSLTLSLSDVDGEIQVIVIRHATDRDGNEVKWKTYGSKKYVPFKIHADEDFVFFYSGMAEILLMELFGFSYIGLQSDSMVRHLPEKLKHLTEDKVIVILQDNDESFKKIVPSVKDFFSGSHSVITMDFEKLLSIKLPKGYDFRDFCNQIANANDIRNQLKKGIKDAFRS